MADETFTIDFVSRTDDMVAGNKRVVASLDDITSALKRAQQQGDGLAKRFAHLAPGPQLEALASKKTDLETRLLDVLASGDPRRRTKSEALRQAIGMISGRMGMLSAATGIGSATAPATGASVAGGLGGAGGAGGGLAGLAGATGVAGLLGGILAGVGMGLVHIVGQVTREIMSWPDEARQTTANIKAQGEAIRKANEWSEGTRENLGMIANAIDTVLLGLKKFTGEALGNVMSWFQIALSGVAKGIGEIIALIPGLGKYGRRISANADESIQAGIAKMTTWSWGLGGTGEAGVVAGEETLGKAQLKENERKKDEAKAAEKRNKRDYQEDYFRRKEQWQGKEYADLIKSFMGGGTGERAQSNGMYAVGGEAFVRAYFDESNNLQREALAELKAIAKNTQMPITERDIYENNVRMW